MTDVEDGKGRGATPPYIAYQSLKTLLGDFKEHGVPGRVDRTVLTRFSGGVGSQILSALRFLGLIEEANHPTGDLRNLVHAFGTEDWQAALELVLRAHYAPLFELDLQSATPGQFMDTFRRAFPGKDDTLRKCVTFFLNAAREAGIGFNNYLAKGAKTRVSAPRGRPAAGVKRQTLPAVIPPPPPPGRHQTPADKPAAPDHVLLGLLDPSTMTEEEQKAIWTLLLYLKKQPPSQNGASQ